MSYKEVKLGGYKEVKVGDIFLHGNPYAEYEVVKINPTTGNNTFNFNIGVRIWFLDEEGNPRPDEEQFHGHDLAGFIKEDPFNGYWMSQTSFKGLEQKEPQLEGDDWI